MTNHITMEKLFSLITRIEKTITPIRQSRFEDSIEVRFQKEDERTKMIEAQIWSQQQPQIYRRAVRRPRKKIIQTVVKTERKRSSFKTINVIYAFLLIVSILFFCYGVDFNMRN